MRSRTRRTLSQRSCQTAACGLASSLNWHGAWGGAGVGALIGILFPPSIIGSAIVGAAVGGVGGHLWKGMSRADVKEFGEAIDAGEAALVVVGQTTIESYLEKAELKAQKRVAKELDLDKGKIDDMVQEAAKSLK